MLKGGGAAGMIQFAICDDEPQMIQEIAEGVARYMKEKQISAYSVSGFSEGAALLRAGPFDVIFLDIQMEGTDGMETARLLRRRGDRSLLIFATVLRDCVFDAFEVEAWDYLVKPLEEERFRRTMDRALQALSWRAAKPLLIQRGALCQAVSPDEIVYCEAQGRKIYLHKTDGEIVDYYDKMKDLESRVDGPFFRCHRSYLVNLASVRGCQAGQILLRQGGTIPVSRLRERALKEALLRYLKEGDF